MGRGECPGPVCSARSFLQRCLRSSPSRAFWAKSPPRGCLEEPLGPRRPSSNESFGKRTKVGTQCLDVNEERAPRAAPHNLFGRSAACPLQETALPAGMPTPPSALHFPTGSLNGGVPGSTGDKAAFGLRAGFPPVTWHQNCQRQPRSRGLIDRDVRKLARSTAGFRATLEVDQTEGKVPRPSGIVEAELALA